MERKSRSFGHLGFLRRSQGSKKGAGFGMNHSSASKDSDSILKGFEIAALPWSEGRA